MDTASAANNALDPAPEGARAPEASVASLADICVKCGLCLQHCPTYRLSGIEGESPRGRIALVQGLVEGSLPASGRTAEHLESCTGCLTCETVCPAKVPYGVLIDRGRAELRRQGHGGTRTAGWLALLSRRPGVTRLATALLRVARRLRVHRLASKLGLRDSSALGRLLHRLRATSSVSGTRLAGLSSATGTDRVKVFAGCLGRSLDNQTLRDAVTVLEAADCSVALPSDQVCCGALDLHDGRPSEAGRLAADNCRAFGEETTPVITLASGCAATLNEYGRLAPSAGEAFVPRLRDVLAYVGDRWERLEERVGRLELRVAVFEPCSARNLAGRPTPVAEILRRVPGIEVVGVDPGYGCCGAAGHHFVTRGEQADALLAPILAGIDELAPDIVAVANIGCALHLEGALVARGFGPEVLHPVSVLARSLAGAR